MLKFRFWAEKCATGVVGWKSEGERWLLDSEGAEL